MTPVTFRRGKKGKQIKFFQCDVEEGRGGRRGRGGQGRKSSSHQPAHWGAELLVIDIWQLIIMAFFLTGHWSTLCRWEKKREGRVGVFVTRRNFIQTHTNKHTLSLRRLDTDFHSLSCLLNGLTSTVTTMHFTPTTIYLTDCNQIIPNTYHNISNTSLNLTTTYLQQTHTENYHSNPSEALLPQGCQYALNKTLNEINGKQRITELLSPHFFFTMKLILELVVIFPWGANAQSINDHLNVWYQATLKVYGWKEDAELRPL